MVAIKSIPSSMLLATVAAAFGCAPLGDAETATDPVTVVVAADANEPTRYPATEAEQPGIAVATPQKAQALPPLELERVSSLVPWPRGIAWVDDKLIVVARGRHRNYGGPAPEILDQEATLFEIDPFVREPYVKGEAASAVTIANGRVLAEPDPAVIHLYDRSRPTIENEEMNRPFCTLVYDAPSRNVIFCAYSGVDLSGKDGGPTFRKNATDALFRYDLRTKRWGVVEKHDPAVVPKDELKAFIANQYYPHHDVATNAPPHGWLNGPNGCAVVGRYVYAVGKDNHTLARYDLEPVRRDPNAGAPPSEFVVGEEIDIRVGGEIVRYRLKGHSAVTSDAKHLYLAFRTANVVVRFPIDSEGAVVKPIVGELIAEFEPYTEATGRGADVWDMVTNAQGELFVSASREGRIWRFTPDPAVPFDGNDKRQDPVTPNKPWIDIRAATGNPKATISNLTFGPDGDMYFCMTMPEADRPHAGVIMRATSPKAEGLARR
jgi:hypothetical protein